MWFFEQKIYSPKGNYMVQPKFTIVYSDQQNIGGNEKGLNLERFLNIFYKRKDVLCLEVNEFQRCRNLKTEFLFVFLPSRVHKDDFASVVYKKIFLVELSDEHRIFWRYTNAESLLSLTNICFKSTIDLGYNYDFDVRLNPIPLSQNIFAPLLNKIPLENRKHDMVFLGMPTDYNHGAIESYNQRIEWLREVVNKFNFFGGLFNNAHYPKSYYENLFGNLDNIYYKGEFLSKFWFMYSMCQSKISLVPAGHHRWTYRHYESILFKNILVSTDITQIKMLLPIPTSSMCIIKDKEPILNVCEKILLSLHEWQDRVEDAYLQLNKYLKNGQYHKSKPLIMDKFLEQLK